MINRRFLYTLVRFFLKYFVLIYRVPYLINNYICRNKCQIIMENKDLERYTIMKYYLI